MYSIFSYSYLSYTYFFLHLLLFLQLWQSPFMWKGAVNECGWARGKCVGFHHSFLSEWQKPDKALEAGLRVQKREKKKENKEQLFSRWPLQNRAEYALQVCGGSACLNYYKSFWGELQFPDGKRSIYMWLKKKTSHWIQLGLLGL